jgi:hypothetical protein
LESYTATVHLPQEMSAVGIKPYKRKFENDDLMRLEQARLCFQDNQFVAGIAFLERCSNDTKEKIEVFLRCNEDVENAEAYSYVSAINYFLRAFGPTPSNSYSI